MNARPHLTFPALAAISAIALTIAGCNNSNEASDNVSTDADLSADAEANAALGANAMNDAAAGQPTDANGFATAVAASDMFEIESGKLAAQKASSADIKSFGSKLQTDHQDSTAKLKAAASQANVTVSPELDPEKQSMLDQLKTASGADFDRMFTEQQKMAHQKALGVLQNYAGNGDNPALKDFATNATKVVQQHLDHLNGMPQQ